ncbi:MAG TPA: tetratricopeptide repeat protein [Bacteroidia bacterium]|nr:tetratricopeptide repeat protein [Bacteroidia bacterium]
MAKVKPERIAPPVKKRSLSDDKKVGYVLGAIAFLLYIQSVGFNYALDDRAVLFDNDFVKDGFGGFGKILSTFYWAGYWESNAGLFRPVSLLLFATEWQIFGDNPGAFHFVHTVLYALVSMQLFFFLRTLFKDSSVTLAFLATLIWIVMPIHTEVAANLKSADEILSLLFSLLAFRQLLKWKDSQQMKTLLFSCGYFFLALLSKEGAALMLPIGLLMLFMFRGATLQQLIRPGIFLFAVSLVWFAWHTWVISNAPAEMITYDYHNNALLSSNSRIDQLGTAIAIQGHYWMKMIVGYPLSYNYSFNEIPVNGFADAWAIVSLIGIAGGLAWSLMNLKKNPIPAFGILFYLVAFALTGNIFYLIGETMGDRLAFVPSVGFAILVSWGILKLTKGMSVQGFHQSALTAGIVICLLWTVLTFTRSKAWAYESTLFTADVEHAPGSARVHYNYGVLLMGNAQSEPDEAKRNQLLTEAHTEFTTAYGIDSLDIQSCFNLGVVEYRRKNYAESVKWSRRVMDILPGYSDVYVNLADAYVIQEQYDSAASYYQKSMDATGKNATVMIKMGNVSFGSKDTAMAIKYYQEATVLDTSSVEALNKLGNVCGMYGDYTRSNEAFAKLAAKNPADPAPWKMMYTNYSLMGDSVSMKNSAQEYYKRGGK